MPANRSIVCLLLLSILSPGTIPQEQEALASYTPAIEQTLRKTISLPGYVESPLKSVLASEIAALVAELAVREGDAVKKGDVLVRLQTMPLNLELKAMQAQLQEAEARSNMAKRNYDRAVDLIKSRTISEQQMDESKYEYDAWQGRIHTLTAEIARIRYDIERGIIRAPFDAVVSARHTEMGQWSDVGDPLLEVISMAVLEIHVDVPERYYTYLKTGMQVTATLDHMADRTYDTWIRAIIPQADLRSHSFPVKLRFRQNSNEIGAGMLARVRLQAGEQHTGVLVPKDAIVRQGPSRVVYVLGDDDTVSPVPVVPTTGMGVWTVVEGNIRAGDRIITRGNERMQPGQKVRAVALDYTMP